MTSTSQLLNILEETATKLKKTQINLKKCPKSRLTLGYLETRLQCVEEYWQYFKNTHQDLVKSTSKDDWSNIQYFVNEDYYVIEDLYLCLKGDLKDMLAAMMTSTSQSEINIASNTQTQVKLPRIQLPEFSGSYEDWPTYHDLFISLVHNNPSLSLVQKLQYLKSSVTGEAESLLKHVKVTDNNYEEAWNILKHRYGNKKLIVNSVLKRLTGQKAIKTPTANQIKILLDTTTECLNSLKNLDLCIDGWDPIIIYLVVQKLDPETHKDWEEHAYTQDSNTLPMWKDLNTFLESKFRTLELVAPVISTTVARERTVKDKSCHVSAITPVKTCTMCNEDHNLCHCQEFIKLQPIERSEFVRKNRLCYNCLIPGHTAGRCRVSKFCRRCNRRHHSLLHQPRIITQSSDNTQARPSPIEGNDEKKEDTNTDVAISSHFTVKKSTALLATALVYVKANNGLTTVLRALIDQGSHESFISERAAQTLKIKRNSTRGTITAIGGLQTSISQVVEIDILSRCEENFSMKIQAYVIPTNITSKLPPRYFNTNDKAWSHLEGLSLADPSYNQPGRVDLLLGVQVYETILKNSLVKGPIGSPTAQETHLGWILFGKVTEDTSAEHVTVMHHHIDIDNMLKSFWEVDVDSKRTLTKEEEICEKIYKETHFRNEEGRFVVKLPFKTENPKAPQGNTRDIAMKRLKQLERRFEGDKHLKTEYTKAMQEYMNLNYMEEVPVNEMNNEAVYLPHHPVFKESSETTKTRIVFNASSKGSNNVSLNDELLVGPQLQEDLRSLIMRWRMKRVCFVADITKMYLQIFVTKKDADFQRILWRNDENEPVKDYRMLRVTFGTASAPYLAVKTLQQLADIESEKYPAAAEAIKHDFFMDDLMSGQDTEKEAIDLARNINYILQGGGFSLQKWSSNSSKFLDQFDSTRHSKQVKISTNLDGTVRTLGLSWNMGADVIHYHLDYVFMSGPVTKRKILAEVHRLFDPLGWLCPAIVPAKMLIQKLWLNRSDWDDVVDPETEKEWISIHQSLTHLKDIKIQRWLGCTNSYKENVSIHGFCDASNKAYGAVAYLRVLGEDHKYKTTIIAAKTRVAPVKPLSLPRLELCGAVLLSKLLKQISEAMRIPASQIFSWTDSTIVLSWLQGDPARWQTFVRNRVVTILDNIGNKWFHVQSRDNPADVASRGMLLSELKNYRLWWEGPEWLKEKEIRLETSIDEHLSLEKRKNINTYLAIGKDERTSLYSRFETFDNLPELLRAIAHMKRFLKFKKIGSDMDSPITTEELEDSLMTCINITQNVIFHEEIKDLVEKNQVKYKSRTKSLNPYLDAKMILRVGGRLKNAYLKYDHMHPMILDNKNILTSLLVAEAHRRTLHGGVQLMLNYLRSRYWILKAKTAVKACIRNCLVCAKLSAKPRTQLMGELPDMRVTPARPFLHSGVDFAGPYDVLMSRGRGAKTNKSYIAIFICMSTKAIHLELVGNLTSEAFIGAFRRFVSRRGRCSDLWSDQGRNFVGANKALADAFKEAKLEFGNDLLNLLASDGTQWHFIPAYSPNFGGLWEAGVKSMKFHLKRILNTHLTFEEMTTVLTQVEACLNSRPLYPMDDSDIENVNVLTPGHFLIGEAPVIVPSPSLKDSSLSHLSRWQHCQKIFSNFWQRWQIEYLSRLQQRPKWLGKQEEFQIGQIVLMKSELLPPGKWPLGRIIAKHPGLDGVTRVYSVKSGSNIVKRSISKLCFLPIDNN